MFEGYLVPGFNYRMTDVQAAIGRAQLRAAAGDRRGAAARWPRATPAAGGGAGVGAPAEPTGRGRTGRATASGCPTGADQRAVMQAMLDRGVATRRGIMCAHLEPAHADLPLRFPLPQSERARDRCILLPLFAGMTEAHAG